VAPIIQGVQGWTPQPDGWKSQHNWIHVSFPKLRASDIVKTSTKSAEELSFQQPEEYVIPDGHC
jgi:hypothetical protein